MVFNDDKVYNLEASRCDSCFYVQTQLLNLKKSVKKRKNGERKKEIKKERILTAAMRNHRSVNNLTLIVVDPHFHPNSSYH